MELAQRGVRDGIIFGIVLVFLALFGLLTDFAETSLLGISVPSLIVAALAFWAGYVAFGGEQLLRPGETAAPLSRRATGLTSSVVAGFLFGGMALLLAWLATAVNVRAYLANMTPLVGEALVGESLAGGATTLLLTTLVLGLVGGAVRLARQGFPLPTGAANGAAAGATLLMSLYLFLSVLVTLASYLADRSFVPTLEATDLWVVLRGTLLAAVIGGLLGALASFVLPGKQLANFRARYGRSEVLVVALISAALIFPLTLGSYWNQVLTTIGIFVMMGLGLNVVVGFAGLLDLGYVAFFAIGAYTYAFLNASRFTEAGFGLLALPIAMAVAALAGVLLGIPVLRMRGDYLAIVTLGFGEIIRLVMNNEVKLTGGPQGILQIAPPSLPGVVFNSPVTFYYLIFAGAVLVGFVTYRLNNSRIGRAWVAMREDEDVARAMGIDTVSYKLMAFAIGAAMAGLGGAIFAARQRNIFPADFGLLVSIEALALLIIGGMGSIPGVIAGAVVLKGLPELLRELQEYRLLIYGALLVAMMLVRPEGILPSRRRAREIHAEDDLLETAQPREEAELEDELYKKSAELRS